MTDSINRSHIAQFPAFFAQIGRIAQIYRSRNRRASAGTLVFLRHTTFSSCTPVSGGQEKMPELRIILDDGLVEEAHAAALAHQMPDELEAADADIRAKRLDRVAALHELSL